MSASFSALVADLSDAIGNHPLREVSGQLAGVLADGLRSTLPDLTVGDVCRLEDPRRRQSSMAQVVGIDAKGALLAPLGPIEGLSPRTRVIPEWRPLDIACGESMLGGIYDGLGRPLDERPTPAGLSRRAIRPRAVNPLARPLVEKPVVTGVRAIDGLNTIGMGQRIGIFGGSGTGKTSLIGSLARTFQCDVCVLGLVGERGRELREFLDRQLPPEFRPRSVVVTATSDRPAMERVTAAHVATAVAEHFRDRGRHVLLVIDSLTRFARALREVGLAAGEAPVRRGFPASVYAELPRLIERSGPTDRGTITAIYTVLSEDETGDDPIVEEVQSLTDGHIHLSRRLGQAGHYPAIDILRSQSRLMNEIVSHAHSAQARHVRALMAKYDEIEMLIQVGEYRRGEDKFADEAVDRREAIQAYLRQGAREVSTPQEMLAGLARLMPKAR